MVQYLNETIAAKKITIAPKYSIALKNELSGKISLTNKMIRLTGDKRWRRVMLLEKDNKDQYFVRYKGRVVYLRKSQVF